jgi:hypothetical protein
VTCCKRSSCFITKEFSSRRRTPGIYDILTVLDTKALALLAFDGIVVVAATFAAEKGGIFHRGGSHVGSQFS